MKQNKDNKMIMKYNMGSPLENLLQCAYPSWLFTNPNKGATLIPRHLTCIKVFGIHTDIRMELYRQVRMQSPRALTASSSSASNGGLETELHKAARVGDMEDARKAVHRGNGELLSRNDGQGNLALHLAVKGGRKEVVLYLLEKYPKGSYQLNREGISPLYLAVIGGYLDLVVPMLEALTQISKIHAINKLKEGKSIIHAAITYQNKEMVRTLLRHQPDLIYLKEDALTPLSYAAHKGCSDIVDYLLRKIPSSKWADPIHKACLGGHVNVLNIFYSSSRDSLLKVDQHGRNILHLASKERGNKLKDVVSFLLNLQDANISSRLKCQKDENGSTPLVLAQRNGNLEVIQLFNRSMH